MLIGLEGNANKLHSINEVDIEIPYQQNPMFFPPVENIVGDFSIPEMQNIEYQILGEELL